MDDRRGSQEKEIMPEQSEQHGQQIVAEPPPPPAGVQTASGEDPVYHPLYTPPSLLESIREGWQNRFGKTKEPPLVVESKPVPVNWFPETKGDPLSRVGSLALHIAVILLLLYIVLHPSPKAPQVAVETPIVTAPMLATPPAPKQIGGGGGARDLHPVSRGKLPKLTLKQPLTAPKIKPLPQPKLPVAPAIVVQPVSVPQPNLPQFGNPNAGVAPPSLGNGGGGGIGPGHGNGLGPGYGANTGGGNYQLGAAATGPRAIYSPDPDFTDAARKAKLQGQVELSIVVGPDGKAHDIRVTQPLGLGLDEKAIEAVKLWRFIPAKDHHGNPIAVQALIDVDFKLY